jgi:hypothetical protein
MDVHITQFNVQLYFRHPVLENTDLLNAMFSKSEGFIAGQMQRYDDDNNDHPPYTQTQKIISFFKEGFRIGPVQSNALPFRILQILSYPNAVQNPDKETIACLYYLSELLRQHLKIDVDADIYAVRVVFHSIVTGSSNIQRILTKLTRIDAIPTLADKYVGHKNPMDAIQFTYKTGGDLLNKFWNDIRVSQFDTNSYVVTIFNETDSLASSLDFIKNVKQFVASFMQEMEEAAIATSVSSSITAVKKEEIKD